MRPALACRNASSESGRKRLQAGRWPRPRRGGCAPPASASDGAVTRRWPSCPGRGRSFGKRGVPAVDTEVLIAWCRRR